MRGNEILGSWYRNNSCYYSHRHKEEGKNSEEEGLEVSLGEEIRGHSSLETSHTSSSNCGGHGPRSSMTRHYASHNSGGCFYIGGFRLQDTRHYFSCNWGTRFMLKGEVHIVLIPVTITPLTKASVVCC